MPRTNDEIAAAFSELAELLEIAGADRFRIFAYQRAATTIEGVAKDLRTLDDKELRSLRGIGKATAEGIHEFLETGTMMALEEARAEVPEGVRLLTTLPGLGPKKAVLLWRELGIDSPESLEKAIDAGSLRGVKGLGAKTEENLQRALRSRGTKERTLLEAALVVAEDLLSQLRQRTGVQLSDYAGSLRRMKETIGDIDLLVGADDPASIMDAFTTLDGVARLTAKGSTKSSIVTSKGMQVDLRVVKPAEFGAALQYFTGSKEHNVKVREHAVKRGFKLSEYGLFTVPDGERIAGETEEGIYRALGMQTPLPTMREDRGEVELSLRGELPEVVQLADIKGDLHCHSLYSDGRTPIRDVVEAAAERGYEYVGISDHAVRLTHIRHLSVDDIKRQAEEIAELNEEMKGRILILHGVELNIGPEGELDYTDDVLELFDYTIASVHQQLGMDRDRMTQRLARALSHPAVSIFGHPTARRIGRRPPIDFDMETIFGIAAEHGVALEISGHGERLDLKDDHIILAREYGCIFSINTDTHVPERLWRMRLGVAMAQRGWTLADEVINTLPLDQLLARWGRGSD